MAQNIEVSSGPLGALMRYDDERNPQPVYYLLTEGLPPLIIPSSYGRSKADAIRLSEREMTDFVQKGLFEFGAGRKLILSRNSFRPCPFAQGYSEYVPCVLRACEHETYVLEGAAIQTVIQTSGIGQAPLVRQGAILKQAASAETVAAFVHAWLNNLTIPEIPFTSEMASETGIEKLRLVADVVPPVAGGPAIPLCRVSLEYLCQGEWLPSPEIPQQDESFAEFVAPAPTMHF